MQPNLTWEIYSYVITSLYRLNFADNFAQPVLCDLRACLMYAKEEAVQPHFDELYTRLQQLHSTAKVSWDTLESCVFYLYLSCTVGMDKNKSYEESKDKI